MKSAISEINHVIHNHFYVSDNDKQDLSIILNTRDMLEVVKSIDLFKYDESFIKYEGEYHIVSSVVVGDTTYFYVEDVCTDDGVLKYDETDVLIIPDYLPNEIKDHFIAECGYETLIELNEGSTFEELASQFKN